MFSTNLRSCNIVRMKLMSTTTGDLPEDRYGYNSGMWIFTNPDFQTWHTKDTTENRVLYVNGIPGAGESSSSVDDGALTMFRQDDSYVYCH